MCVQQQPCAGPINVKGGEYAITDFRRERKTCLFVQFRRSLFTPFENQNAALSR